MEHDMKSSVSSGLRVQGLGAKDLKYVQVRGRGFLALLWDVCDSSKVALRGLQFTFSSGKATSICSRTRKAKAFELSTLDVPTGHPHADPDGAQAEIPATHPYAMASSPDRDSAREHKQELATFSLIYGKNNQPYNKTLNPYALHPNSKPKETQDGTKLFEEVLQRRPICEASFP